MKHFTNIPYLTKENKDNRLSLNINLVRKAGEEINRTILMQRSKGYIALRDFKYIYYNYYD